MKASGNQLPVKSSGCQPAAGSRLVVDYHWSAQGRRELVCNDAREVVGASSRGITHDDGEGLARRLGQRAGHGPGKQCCGHQVRQ